MVFFITLSSCASLLAPCTRSILTASTLLTAEAQCKAVFPQLSAAFISASAFIKSSTIPSIANLENKLKLSFMIAHWKRLSVLTFKLKITNIYVYWLNKIIIYLAASINGVVPSCILAFKLVARFLNKIWNTPMASEATAACKGVLPVLSATLASAPASSNRLAASALAYL